MNLTTQNVVTWHDRSTGQHKDLVDSWASKDFRTLSLSLYGTPLNPLFAAVMVKRPTVIATKQIGPVDQAGFQQAFDDLTKQGWGPYVLTATGPAGSALFAAVFTPMASIPLTRHVLTGAEFEELNGQAQKAGAILQWADAYGTANDIRYAGIWGPNPSGQAWNCDARDEGGAALQARYEAMKATWCRPAHLAVTPTARLLEMFVDSTLSGNWASVAGLTSAGYQDAYDKAVVEGQLPIRVSASGSGSSTRFAAIFADRDDVKERTFRSNGPVTVAAVDAAMKDFIQQHNLRGAALAITLGSRLVYAKGYTFAEPAPTYPDVLPTTFIRQASVSKTFAAVAMWRLLQQKPSLTLDTTMQSVLHLKQPSGAAPKDSRFDDITLRHLLESTSGLPQGLYGASKQAVDADGAQLPAHSDQLASYGASFDLTGDPGSSTNVVYGNYDYFMLSRVITKLANAPSFPQALHNLVLNPLKMIRTRHSRSLIELQSSDEARYHLRVYNPDKDLYPLRVAPNTKEPTQPISAWQYGRRDYEIFAGCGGLSSSVVDVARLVAMFSDRSDNPVLNSDSLDLMFTAAVDATSDLTGPDPHGYHGFDGCSAVDVNDDVYSAGKGGYLPSHQTAHQFTTGGFGFVIARLGNDRPGGPPWFPTVSQAAAAHSWPSTDLFPDFGMPSLAPTRIPAVAISTAALAKLATIDVEAQVRDSMSSGLDERSLPA